MHSLFETQSVCHTTAQKNSCASKSVIVLNKKKMEYCKMLQLASFQSGRRSSQLISKLHVGVILESEDLHRVAYNATFEHFRVQPKGEGDYADWSVEFYDKLQNSIGGGKPKMRWYFGRSQYGIRTCLAEAVVKLSLS